MAQSEGGNVKQIITGSVIVLLVWACMTVAFESRADEPDVDAGADNQALSTEDLEVLAAPIALYPDALVAQVLPAATFTLEVPIAARWVRAHPDLAGLNDQPWDPSVKAVARFPEVIQMMDDNLDSTTALGDAFVNQQADLMDAIQQLRIKFRTDGSLVDTPQQRIVMDGSAIQIVPVNPGFIYVPRYRPIVDFGVAGVGFSIGPLTFGAEIGIGDWLDLDFDWHRHCVFFGRYDRYGGWEARGGRMWSHPHFERHNFNIDVRHMNNVNIRNAENIHSRNITNTRIRNVTNTNVRNVNKTNVRNVKSVNNVNITHRAESTHETNTGFGEIAHGATVQKHSARGQNSRETAHLSTALRNAAPKTHTAPAPAVHRSAEPGAFAVRNGAAEHAASSRGSASRSSAGSSRSSGGRSR